MSDAKRGALESLRQAYREQLTRCLNELRPLFVRGHAMAGHAAVRSLTALRASTAAGNPIVLDDSLIPVAREIEKQCKAALCRTNQDARLIFALSPHWEEMDSSGGIREEAAVLVALDLADLLGHAGRWFLEWYGCEEGRSARAWRGPLQSRRARR